MDDNRRIDYIMKQLTNFVANTNLHVIAYKGNFALCHDKNNKAHFVYFPNKDCMMDFDLLSHCIQEYREWAKDILSKLKYKIGTEETDNDYYNTIIKTIK